MRKTKLALAAFAMLLAAEAHSATYVLHASNWGASQDAAVASAGGAVKFKHAGAGVAVVESNVPGFMGMVLASGAVAGGQPDMTISWADPVTYDVDANAVSPTDDRFYSAVQWAPQSVNAPGAWARGYTGAGVRVAVIDGGIFNAHPDLAGAVDVAASRSFVAPNPADTPAGNACRVAFNCDTGTFWHGTHVSGIIAARDNTIGVVGIAPAATIIGVKALHNGSGSFGAVIEAIVYAATEGNADIINMSLGALFDKNEEGGKELRKAMKQAVDFANDAGVLVVVSAGNDALDLDHAGTLIVTPAESGKALAVSATGPLGFALGATNFSRPASYSNFGSSLVYVSGPGGDFALPGEDPCTLPTTTVPVTIPCWAFDMVLSTSRAGYTWSAGTSMSAPAVSAVAALIKQKDPGATPNKLKNKLKQSASDAGKKGHDNFHGHGFVNADAAVK